MPFTSAYRRLDGNEIETAGAALRGGVRVLEGTLEFLFRLPNNCQNEGVCRLEPLATDMSSSG